MSVQSEIERITGSVAAAYAAAYEKGAKTQSPENVGNLAGAVASIPGGISLIAITITTPPKKTVYTSGERFDPAGMVVTATYSNGATLIATGYAVEPDGGLTEGTASVTIRYTEGGVTATARQGVKVKTVSPVLNDNDWDVIREVSNQSQGGNYWSVGDLKSVTMNGTVGHLTFSNETYYACILGFDHNKNLEGSGKIHFQLAKTALVYGDDVAFADSEYAKTTVAPEGYFSMNTSNSNAGGWEASQMRKNICGNGAQSTEGTIISVLPTELIDVLKSVTKYTDNVGGGGVTSDAVSATEDVFFLLSEYEVYGTNARGNPNEASRQERYAYYAAGNPATKYNYKNTDNAVICFLRTPRIESAETFTTIYTSGSVADRPAGRSLAFLPAFCV